MPAIEKICEFSGEFPGYKMYDYKRNHIQIMPKYRKLFRGADAVLIVDRINTIFLTRFGYLLLEAGEPEPWWKGRFVKEYWFTLQISNPELYGQVKGLYVNYTYSLRQTKKRLKRMLRCRELKVLSNNVRYNEFNKRLGNEK